MKRRVSSAFLAVMLAVQLIGCGAEEKEASGVPDTAQGTESSEVSDAAQGAESSEASDAANDDGSSSGQEEFAGPGGIPDPTAVMGLEGKDNSLDIFSATARVPLQPENPENAIEGGGQMSVLGVSGAFHLKKHLMKTAIESWDEVFFVTAEGKAGSERFDLENQHWHIGPVAGTNHYVSLGSEIQEGGEDYRYFIAERDENQEIVREFPLDCVEGEYREVIGSLSSLAVDKSGVAHLVRSMGENLQYLLVSQEGEILTEYIPSEGIILELVPLYDGRIAFLHATNGDNGGIALQYLDGVSDKPVTLASYGREKSIYYMTLFDENTLLYADGEGVYRSGLAGENPELLYRWINHGILARNVPALQADEEGRISLIYSDSENNNYLCLEPTTEEVPLREITMEVNPSNMNAYRWLVTEFNKRYPTCHIELVERNLEDNTALLTQLTAGKGPVLIDPFMLDFEGLEKLWEPLDTIMEQLGVSGELQPAVLEMGKINGTLYGLVRDFSLLTVVTGEPDLKDWNFDTFIQCVRDMPDMNAICNYYNRDVGIYYLLGLLDHGLDNNYYIVQDGETGAMHFDSDRFRQTLEMSEKYFTREMGVEPGSSLLEGKTLGNTLTIYKPEHLAAYRAIYGEDINYIGYPGKDGGAHFMEPCNMLAVRRSATKEEKEVAAAFIALYLSYDGQLQLAKDVNFRFSVRKDVLEEQLASMQSETSIWEFGEVNLAGKLNIELDRATMMDLIDKAMPVKYLPGELDDIIDEELDLYLAGSITMDMLLDHLENRVELYLGERN